MINDMLKNVKEIYIAYGVTDFRMQTHTLCRMIEDKFLMDPYNNAAFIFCNRKRNSIRVLCYDKNGFVLAQKTLLDVDKMKFQWPSKEEEIKQITKQQLNWLLSGLKIVPDRGFKEIHIDRKKIAI